jgi:hypothetical protein
MASPLLDLAGLLPAWQLAMRAERKSPGTIKTCTDGVHRFLRWCAQTDHPAELTKATVQAFMADLLNSGAESDTAASRRTALKRFVAWLVDEGELNADPLLGLKAPKSDHKVVHALTDDERRRLLKACQGKSLQDRRDAAIVRLMAETGMRASEVIGLQVADVNLPVTLAEPPIRKSAALLMAVGALTLRGAVAHADTQSPAPTPPPDAPKCLTFGGQPPQWHYLPCGWSTDGKRWTPPPPPGP